MSLSVSPPKNPDKQRAGLLGAHARWGDQRRIVRLDDLTGEQRALVLALVESMGTRKAAPAGVNAGTASETEGHGNGTPIAS